MTGGINIEPTQFFLKHLIALSFTGLALERNDLPFHFTDDVGEAQQVGVGLLEFA